MFNRLGGPAGGAFARLSGLGGDRRGESWHKITVNIPCRCVDQLWSDIMIHYDHERTYSKSLYKFNHAVFACSVHKVS